MDKSPMFSLLFQSQTDPGTATPVEAVADSVPGGAGTLVGWVSGISGLSAESLGKITTSLLVLLGIYILRRIVVKVVDRKVDNARLTYQWSKGSSQVAFVLALLLVAMIWLEASPIEKSIALLDEKNINIINKLEVYSYGKTATLEDPDGNCIGLYEPPEKK